MTGKRERSVETVQTSSSEEGETIATQSEVEEEEDVSDESVIRTMRDCIRDKGHGFRAAHFLAELMKMISEETIRFYANKRYVSASVHP